jgi:protochlorophyllide reductase
LALLRTGDYHVVGAVREYVSKQTSVALPACLLAFPGCPIGSTDRGGVFSHHHYSCHDLLASINSLDKMEAVAEVDGFDLNNFTPMYCELNSFASVRDFCDKLDEFRMSKSIDRLICNAGVYQPTLPYAKWSMDGHEQTMQINYLSHFLMISKLMPALMQSQVGARVIMVGSVTGNDNTVGGGGVYPIADLHELEGFEHGFNKPIAMADGYGFIGAKAYKDSKLCLMMMANFLHTKYNKLTGVAFSSMYPGCIAESPLFREKRPWFRKYFPIFMKFITGEFFVSCLVIG